MSQQGEKLYNPARHGEVNMAEVMKKAAENGKILCDAINAEIANGGIIRHENGFLEATPKCAPLPHIME
jgi:hypothetical protein